MNDPSHMLKFVNAFCCKFDSFLMSFICNFLYVCVIHFVWLSKSDLHLVMFDSGLEKLKEQLKFIYAFIFVFYSLCAIKHEEIAYYIMVLLYVMTECICDVMNLM